MSVEVIKQVGLRSALAVAVASVALTGCGGGSSGGGGGHVISLNGGTGGTGASSSGGSGEYFEIYKQSGAGDVKVLNSGTANAAFTAHTITPSLGDNPAVVTVDTTPDLYADCSATVTTTTGNLYMVVNNTNLYISNGDAVACDSAEVASGLQVKKGATLTVPVNYTAWGNWGWLQFSADVENRGGITTADYNATDRGNLYIEDMSFLNTGTINLSGTASVPNGGGFEVWSDYATINSAVITADGADSSTGNGGSGGYVDLESGRYTQNTAKLSAHGGKSTFAGGVGGSADYLELYSDGPLYNSGTLDGRGGEGATGGSGADVYVDAETLGDNYNSGDILAYGANSTVGNGGDGGYVEFYAYGGELRNSGDVLAYGGDTTDTAGNGGSGNELYVYAYYGSLYEYTPVGDITWSGDIKFQGGNAVATGTGSGGSAGNVYVDVDGGGETAGSDVAFVGYSALNTYGGDGNYGGSADDYDLYNKDYDVYGYDYVPVFGGNIISQVKVDAHGGNAVATGLAANASGGNGGYIEMESDYYATAQLVPKSQMVMHTGDINKAGGTNRNATSNSSGRSRGMWIWGYNGVTWNGDVKADGGNDIGTTGGTTGYGGRVDWLEWYAELGPVAFNGSLSANGGDGLYSGGSHSGIDAYGATIKWSGNISANGGNASAVLAGSTGGDGSWIEFKATDPAASSVSGTISVNGGTGTTAGTKGTVAGLLTCAGPNC